MINFEEELEKFSPSLEIGQEQSDILKTVGDTTDMTDIVIELLKEIKTAE